MGVALAYDTLGTPTDTVRAVARATASSVHVTEPIAEEIA
jgi:hypothetical protein